MTATQLTEHIGKTVEYHLSSPALTISVRIKDARVSYGKPQYQVEPVGGHGLAWVADTKITW